MLRDPDEMADLRQGKQKRGKRRGEGTDVQDMIRSYQESIPNYVVHDGIPYPGCLLSKRVANIKDFEIRCDDVIICGYPRSGKFVCVCVCMLPVYVV